MAKLQANVFYTLATLMALGAFSGSLLVQFVFSLNPCGLCILQRVLFLLIAVVLLLGLAVRPLRLLAGVLGLLSALGVAGVAFYQGWIASDKSLGECGQASPLENTLWWLADHVNSFVFAPLASCLDAASERFLGLPMPFWSVLMATLIASVLLTWLKMRSRD